MKTLQWQSKRFRQLNNTELYELLKFRVDIFVVEQNCPYPELDDKDTHIETHHITAHYKSKLIAYARLLSPGIRYPEVNIGRLAVGKSLRHQRIGTLLMEKCLQEAVIIWPGLSIKISAQEHLKEFYENFGFKKISAMYLEDNIPHITMLKDH
ncbi:MAG: GNAT family N-acetyltransferase [Gammaproteobacteria bacterium]